MKAKDLRTSWKSLTESKEYFDKEQLNFMIMEKYKKLLKQRIDYMGLSILICVVVLAYVVFTGLMRLSDPYFVIVNSLLAVYLGIVTVLSIKYFRRLTSPGAFTEGVKHVIEKRADLMEKGFKRRKWDLALIYPLGVFLTLSINVFFEKKPLLEVLQNEESLWGLAFGLLVGLVAATIYYKKVTKYFDRQIKDLRNNLSELE